MSKVSVEVGQRWEIVEPSGKTRHFTISHIHRAFGRRVARGVTSGGHPLVVSLSRLETGQFGARLLADAPKEVG